MQEGRLEKAALMVLMLYFVLALLQSKAVVQSGFTITSRISSKNLLKRVDRALTPTSAGSTPTSGGAATARNKWYVQVAGRWITMFIPVLLVGLHMSGVLETMVESLRTETPAPPLVWSSIFPSARVDEGTGGRLVRLGDVKTGSFESCDVLFFCGNQASLHTAPKNQVECAPMWAMRHPDDSIGIYRPAPGYAAPTQVTVAACRRGNAIYEGKPLRRLWFTGKIQTWRQRLSYMLYQRSLLEHPLTLRFHLHDKREHRLVIEAVEEEEAHSGGGAGVGGLGGFLNGVFKKDKQDPPLLNIYAEKYRFKKRSKA